MLGVPIVELCQKLSVELFPALILSLCRHAGHAARAPLEGEELILDCILL